MSSARWVSTASMQYLTIASASCASSWRSAKAISGSIIQNSARWREVLEFSARKVGPKVYTRLSEQQYVSTLSWPDTVRCDLRAKKSLS